MSYVPEGLDLGPLPHGGLLQDQLLQLGGGGDEPDITALAHLGDHTSFKKDSGGGGIIQTIGVRQLNKNTISSNK